MRAGLLESTGKTDSPSPSWSSLTPDRRSIPALLPATTPHYLSSNPQFMHLTRSLSTAFKMLITQSSCTTLPHLREAVEQLTPLSLAEKSWDNVGLLVEAPIPKKIDGAKTIFTCIDREQRQSLLSRWEGAEHSPPSQSLPQSQRKLSTTQTQQSFSLITPQSSQVLPQPLPQPSRPATNPSPLRPQVAHSRQPAPALDPVVHRPGRVDLLPPHCSRQRAWRDERPARLCAVEAGGLGRGGDGRERDERDQAGREPAQGA